MTSTITCVAASPQRILILLPAPSVQITPLAMFGVAGQ